MYKGITIISIIFSTGIFAQNKQPKTVLDTVAIEKQAQADLDAFETAMADPEKSNASLILNFTNSAFSNTSKTLSASALEQKLFFVPTFNYYHKSGLGLAANAYFDFGTTTSNPLQYSISPSYEYNQSKDFSFGGAYTFYFGRDTASKYSSPYQHELYAFYTNKQNWLRWGFSADFATGNSVASLEKDTVVIGALGNPHTVHLTAINNSTTTDFLLSTNIGHNFISKNIFTKNDDLSIYPSLVLNAGTSKYSATFTGANAAAFANTKAGKKRLAKAGSGTQNTPFQFQSVALALQITYEVGKFSVLPEMYGEYYLPKHESKFAGVFSLGIGYNF